MSKELLKKIKEAYKPTIIENVQVDGISMQTLDPGESGKMMIKGLLRNDDPNFNYIVKNILIPFGIGEVSDLNRLLIVIDKDNQARVFRVFPLTIGIKAKKDIKAGQLLFIDDIVDILDVRFSDAFTYIKINDNDKLIWIHRVDFRIICFFDFSGLTQNKTRFLELGLHKRQLLYQTTYDFLSENSNLDKLIKDGWFPFVRLLGGSFDKLIQYYNEDEKYNSHIKKIIGKFTIDYIDSFTKYWWRNSIYNEKIKIIKSGLSSYNLNSEEGNILCIKTLTSEIEGIIRNEMFLKEAKTNPTTNEMIDYVKDISNEKFNLKDSLGFPEKIEKYLRNVLFKGFDISEMQVPTSRHSVSHGVARIENYTRARALQLILLLDQIYYYIT